MDGERIGEEEIVALTAYLQRLGTDIKAAPPPASPKTAQLNSPTKKLR